MTDEVEQEAKRLLRRHEVPPYLKMPAEYTFDIDKILAVFQEHLGGLEDHQSDRDFIVSQNDRGYTSYSAGNYNLYTVTEFDPDFKPKDNGVMKNIAESKKDPRWEERAYVKIADWVKGTYIEEVLKTFKGQVSRCNVRVMDPGGKITEHMDYDTTFSVRYHIPLITNDKAWFTIRRSRDDEPEIFRMEADGSTYFLNQGILHAAFNEGDTSRIHLMICVNGQEDLQSALS